MLDTQPTLDGPLLHLRPLRPDDYDAVYAFARDPAVWDLHPDRYRWQPERFALYFDGAIAGGSAVVAELRASGAVVACSRWY